MKQQIENILKQIIKNQTRFFYFSGDKYLGDRDGLSFKGDWFSLIHDKEIKCERNPYMPHVLMTSLPPSFGTAQGYKKLVYNIEDGVSLIMQINVGSMSGVGYEKGWEIQVGINWYNTMINMYRYKTSGSQYEIKGVLCEEFYKLIDYSKFVPGNNDSCYISEYTMFYNSSGKADYSKLLELYVENDTFYFYNSFSNVLDLSSSSNNLKAATSALSKMNFTKFIAKNEVQLRGCKLPETCTYIDFQFLPYEGPDADKPWTRTTTKEMLKYSLEDLSKYAHLFDSKYQEAGKKTQENLLAQEKLSTDVILTFEYKGLYSMIFTNQYAFDKMKDYYQKNDAIITICDTPFSISGKTLIKKIKAMTKYNSKQAEKTEQFLGDKIGNCDWWLNEFDKYPEEIYA